MKHSRATVGWWGGLFLLSLALGLGGAGAIKAASSSTLATLAASMPPGTWAQLMTNNINTILLKPNFGNVLEYANKIPWDPVNRKLYFCGASHHDSFIADCVSYSDTTNSWTSIGMPPGLTPFPQYYYDNSIAHGYDHNAFDPTRGYFYHHVRWETYRYSASAGWSQLPAFPFTSDYNNLFDALEYFPEMDGLVWISGAGNLYLFKESTNQWTRLGTWKGSGTTWTLGVYNPIHKVMLMYAGQNNVLAKLNSSGQVTALRTPPVSIYNGSNGLLTVDPVTGDYIALAGPNLTPYKYDVLDDTWQLLTSTNQPNFSTSLGVVAHAISNYGVILFTNCMTSCTVYLYKHAASVPPPPDTTPPTVSITAPTAGAIVSGTITVSGIAFDNVGVTGVQFKVDGNNLGAEDTSAPYSILWNTTLASNDSHALAAVARDAAGNQTTSSGVTITVSNTPDTTPPATPTGLTATAISASQINLSWTASTDNVGVTGYRVERCQGSGCTSFTQIATPATNSYSDTGLTGNTTYQYQVRAVDGTGNISEYSTTASAITQASSGGSDFQARCSAPGVVKCGGFDDPTEIAGRYGANSGIDRNSPSDSLPLLDTTIKASGTSALKFTVLPGQSGGSAGYYWTNFSPDLSVQFGANSEFYVQWRQRFSPNFLSGVTGDGWKQIIAGTGDQLGQIYSACSTLEVVMQNIYGRGFPQMYNSCTGSTSHGAYDAFEQPLGNDYMLENARPSPYCLYSQGSTSYFPPTGTCFPYVANEWMTFQLHIQVGPRGAAGVAGQSPNDEFVNSHVELWGAREGQPSQPIINWGPYHLSAGSPSENQRYGKIWLLPYSTGGVFTQGGQTWYDELIVSRNKIADPGAQGLRGDLDADQDVDLDDLRRMIFMLIGTVAPALPLADLDGDGQLLLVDLQTLVRILVGIP